MKKGEHKGRKAPGDRGLYDYARIVDTYGNTITVRTSSAACERAIWIFTKDMEGRSHTTGAVGYPDGIATVEPHLNVAAAKKLRDALNRFIRDEERP